MDGNVVFESQFANFVDWIDSAVSRCIKSDSSAHAVENFAKTSYGKFGPDPTSITVREEIADFIFRTFTFIVSSSSGM